MPDLAPAEQLAVEIDRFTHDYDEILYHDSTRNMTENVSELHELILQESAKKSYREMNKLQKTLDK